jgi:Putative MetA-pathway of phenol degradation
MRRRAAAFVVGAFATTIASSTVFADEDERPDATPYRPTVTTPAALSAPHWLEGEFGGLFTHDGGADDSTRRASVPYALKYAFSEDWGVRVQGEGLVHVRSDGFRETGFGDTQIVVKRRFAVNDAQAFGLEAGALYPTARPALQAGSGKPDYSINGIYSVDVAGFHADANVIETRLGARDDGTSRWQTLAALAVSHPLTDRWQIAGEFAATRQPGASTQAQFLGALSYSLRRDIVLDAGAIRGLNHASSSWQAFAGMTIVLGKLD